MSKAASLDLRTRALKAAAAQPASKRRARWSRPCRERRRTSPSRRCAPRSLSGAGLWAMERFDGSSAGRAKRAKMDAHAGEQERRDVPKRRQAWLDGRLDGDPDGLIFIDETWAKANMARGRCNQGRGRSRQSRAGRRDPWASPPTACVAGAGSAFATSATVDLVRFTGRPLFGADANRGWCGNPAADQGRNCPASSRPGMPRVDKAPLMRPRGRGEGPGPVRGITPPALAAARATPCPPARRRHPDGGRPRPRAGCAARWRLPRPPRGWRC